MRVVVLFGEIVECCFLFLREGGFGVGKLDFFLSLLCVWGG